MQAKLLSNFKKILVVGATYNYFEKLQKIEYYLPKYDQIIINGNICYPFIEKEIEEKINIIDYLSKSNKVHFNLGKYELINLYHNKYKDWFLKKSNVIIFDYKSNQSIIITNGGITSNMKKNDLLSNIETTFVSNINNIPWHIKYGGGFGYVISNNPLTKESPIFYNFSAQIGNLYESKNVFAQEVFKNKLGETISL